MDMSIILGLIGGLGLFLYGMKLMSDSLSSVAGAKLRKILETMTKNTFVGLIVGMLFTAVVQSSSATTVLVVSFVNAGLMNLYQATGIIMGANIGTTITGQLIAFNLSEVAPLFVLVGVMTVMVSKKINVQKIGEVILGFGILFMGLSTMSSAMSTLKDSPMIMETLSSLTNPFLGVFVGFIITAVLQSSSATVGIVILLASQGLLDLNICFYIILGCNMGSCVSALLASLGGKKNAKRAAYIHFLINIFGSAVIVAILMLFIDPIREAIMSLTGSQNLVGEALNQAMARNVANAHTIFKVFQIAICYPFAKLIVKLTYYIISGDDTEQEFELKFINNKNIISPTTAIPQAIAEVERMAYIAKENLNTAVYSLLSKDISNQEKIAKNEDYIDFLNHSIFDYLNHINTIDLPESDSKMIGPIYHVISDIERIGDHAKSISYMINTCVEKGYDFKDNHKVKIKELFVLVDKNLKLTVDMFVKQSYEHLIEIIETEEMIDYKEKELQIEYLRELKKNEVKPREGMLYSDLVASLERIGDHATNIAFSILSDDNEEVKAILENEQYNIAEYHKS